VAPWYAATGKAAWTPDDDYKTGCYRDAAAARGAVKILVGLRWIILGAELIDRLGANRQAIWRTYTVRQRPDTAGRLRAIHASAEVAHLAHRCV